MGVPEISDCSIVTATYSTRSGRQGTIGIIGPKRMDYEHVMNSLKTVKATLSDVFGRPGAAGGGGMTESEDKT